jgi:hypothetical protein
MDVISGNEEKFANKFSDAVTGKKIEFPKRSRNVAEKYLYVSDI